STSISPRSLPSLSVTLYLPPGKSSRSNVILPFSSVVSVNFSPSSDSNVISSSVTGLPSWSSTSTVNSSQTFGSSSGTITVLTLSSPSSLYSTSISSSSLPSLSVTLYLPSVNSSRFILFLPFSSVVSVNFSPSSDSNVISSSVTGLPSWSSTSTVNSSQTFGSSKITVWMFSSQSTSY